MEQKCSCVVQSHRHNERIKHFVFSNITRLTRVLFYNKDMNYEAELDRVFSIWVRLSRADHSGYIRCFTCGLVIDWREAQAGHFHLRSNDSVRFDERNVRAQCPDCNLHRNGMPQAFEENLLEELGGDEMEKLSELARDTRKFSTEEYKELIKFYKMKIKKLGVII